MPTRVAVVGSDAARDQRHAAFLTLTLRFHRVRSSSGVDRNPQRRIRY